jgi:hypothetical protein
MRFRRNRPERDVGELRRGARDTELDWAAELAEEPGIESHESTDDGPRRARRDRPIRLPDDRTIAERPEP